MPNIPFIIQVIVEASFTCITTLNQLPYIVVTSTREQWLIDVRLVEKKEKTSPSSGLKP